MRTYFTALFALALVSFAQLTQAQSTITFHLFPDEAGAGTFNLYATTDAAAGISGYGVDLVGVTSMNHNSPNATRDDGTFSILGPVGFRLGRSADGVLTHVLASQDFTNANAGLLYEVGIAPSNFAMEETGGLNIIGPEGDNWGGANASIPGSPVLLASGTYSGSISFNESGPNLGANVWPNIGATTVVTANTAFNIVMGVDPNEPGENTPPTVDNLFPGEATFDQHTLATFTNPASYQMQGTDAEDGDDANLDWELNTFTGPFAIDGVTPLPGTGNGAQALSSTGLFTWDPTGSALGFYFAGVTVTDSGGLMDTGILRVQVPEPGVLVLAGIGLIGIVASRRRLS
jgi:hypothetical protein